ncbi:MAG TPA: acyltransferase [Bacteroidales bacterium]|nr:acyltransferase [Bacteroidales bacterium]
MKKIFFIIEDLGWCIRCSYNLWLHGPYGLSKVIEKIPYRFIIKYLRKYGAIIGENCRFERGINIHRPLGKKKPFENLTIGNDVYLGHNILIDLTEKVVIRDYVMVGAKCQLWTHTGYYSGSQINNPDYRESSGEIFIDEGAIIYSNVIITHSVRIGKFARIGANSLVNKNVPEMTFAGGVPLRIIKVL